MTKQYKYCIFVHKDYYDRYATEFYDNVYDTLKDKNGWKKHGYIFTPSTSNNSDIYIYLTTPEFVKRNIGNSEKDIYGNPVELSYTLYKNVPRMIYINGKNWINGVEKSKLSINDYRIYVINHEVGHAIGYDHNKCKNNVCPIMYQMTKGVPNGFIPSKYP